jgi:hypothetical protein
MIKIKQRTIQALDALAPDELLSMYEILLSLKPQHSLRKVSRSTTAYLQVREALKGCQGALADDILLDREERI